MKYFRLKNSADKSIGREYPQCKGWPESLGYSYSMFSLPNSMSKLTNEYYPEVEPNLIFELKETAKLTDVISPSNLHATGILMNRKTRDIFEQFVITEHRYYIAKVLFKSLVYEYYWLHFLDVGLDFLNIQESEFYQSNLYEKLDKIKFSSYQEYLEIGERDLLEIFPEKVVFNMGYESLQVFKMPKSILKIANELVVNKLRKAKITGLAFEEI